jgi:type II secretory pathway pseudopilin PulG
MKPSRPEYLAFSLVEVVLAIGIVGFALLAIVGVMPLGLKSVKEGSDEMAALAILGALETDLRISPGTNSASTLFGIDRVKSGIQGAAGSPIYLNSDKPVSSVQDARYRLLVENLAPVSSVLSSNSLYRCRAKVSWPAGARLREDSGQENASGSVEVYLSVFLL